MPLYLFQLSLSLFEAAVEVSNTIREEFKCTTREVMCDKADRTLLMSDDRHNDIMHETKEAREKKRNGASLSAKDYRHLKRFDIISIGNNEKLIHATEESNSKLKYYYRIGDMFDMIESAHHKLGHTKDKTIETELKRKYFNMTREVPNAYLKLCQSCALK